MPKLPDANSAGVDDLGAINRGEGTEIATYLEQALNSELSGNIIDLCPVGALTSKPYAFNARPWELKKTESIDAHDAVGANIRIDSRGREVMRILPRLHEDVNEEWLTDKSRFSYDGLKAQRLDSPYVKKDGRLQATGWSEAFDAIKSKLDGMNGSKIAAIAGDMVCTESQKALKDLMTALGSPHTDCRQDGAKIGGGARSGYLFNSTIAGIEDADALLIVGANPRTEASLINARIRKRWKAGPFPIALIGEKADLTYGYEYLGAGSDSLTELAEGKLSFFEVLSKAERPMVIIGSGALTRTDSAAILALVSAIVDKTGMIGNDWNGFNILHTAAGRVGGMDMGFMPDEDGHDVAGILDGAASGDIELVYLLGADEIDMSKLSNSFVVYQGSHGDAGAAAADVILPGAAYTEKDAIWVNMEGRPQLGKRAIFPPGEAKEDWTIVRALSENLDKTLPYDNLLELRAKMIDVAPHLADIDIVSAGSWAAEGKDGPVSSDPLMNVVENLYQTDPISRASVNMANCTASFVTNQQEATGTNG